jgi:hypothetical protein
LNILCQIFAIARTEFRFSFRRSAPVVMMTLIGLIVGIGILIVPIGGLKDWTYPAKEFSSEQVEKLAEEGFSPEEYEQLVIRFSADWFSGSGILLASNIISIALLLLPIATISSIPADRKFGVMEILRSTPITAGRYLAGKILGVLSAILLVGLGTLLFFLATLEVVLFYYLDIGMSTNTLFFYLQYSMMDGLPIIVSGTLTGVLLGVVFRTRRAAIFPGLIIGVVSLFAWLSVFKAPQSIFPVLDKATYFALQNYHSDAISTMVNLTGVRGISLLGEGAPPLGIGQVILMYGTILSILVVLFFLSRLYLHWKDNF